MLKIEQLTAALKLNQGVLRLWVVAAVLWTVIMAFAQYSHYADTVAWWYQPCHALAPEGFRRCEATFLPVLPELRWRRFGLWVFYSVGGALLILAATCAVLRTSSWVRAGFRSAE